jgi:hypothetical protein
LIEIHFDELCAALRGATRKGNSPRSMRPAQIGSRRCWRRFPRIRLLDGGKALETAAQVIVSIVGGPELSMADVKQVMAELNQRCPNAQITMGATVAEEFSDRLSVTLIATNPAKVGAGKVAAASPVVDAAEAEGATEFTTELLHPTEPERPKTRVVPPAPPLTTGATRGDHHQAHRQIQSWEKDPDWAADAADHVAARHREQGPLRQERADDPQGRRLGSADLRPPRRGAELNHRQGLKKKPVNIGFNQHSRAFLDGGAEEIRTPDPHNAIVGKWPVFVRKSSKQKSASFVSQIWF